MQMLQLRRGEVNAVALLGAHMNALCEVCPPPCPHGCAVRSRFHLSHTSTHTHTDTHTHTPTHTHAHAPLSFFSETAGADGSSIWAARCVRCRLRGTAFVWN